MNTINHHILSEAIRVTTDRPNTHGDSEANFNHTAGLWSAYLGFKISAADVCQMQVLAKMSRSKVGNANHSDHYIDQAGYSSLAGRMAMVAPVNLCKMEKEMKQAIVEISQKEEIQENS
jgi:hypothetical protein